MQAVRRLPYVAIPAEQETLSSWMDRTATALDLERRDLWIRTGLTDRPNERPRGYGVELDDRRCRLLAEASGLSESAIGSMLLRRPRSAALFAGVFGQSSLACPHCLRDTGGVWQLAWRLPWSFVCPKHRCYLVGRCVRCGAAFQSNPVERRQQFLCCARGSSVPAGRNCGPRPGALRAGEMCGSPVTAVATPSAGAKAIALQARICQLVESPGESDRRRSECLGDLHSLMAFMLLVGVPALVAGADEGVRERFTRYVAERDRDTSRQHNDPMLSWRPGLEPTVDPQLTAAALTAAEPVAFASERDDKWESVMATVMRDLPNAALRWSQLGDASAWSPPKGCQAAFTRAHRRRTLVIAAASPRHASRGCRRTAEGKQIDARHVPELLWPKAFRYLANGLVEGGEQVWERRGAAYLLAERLEVRLAANGVVSERLSRDLKLESYAHQWRSRFASARASGPFTRRLECLTSALAAAPAVIDYRQRERVLECFATIDPRVWAEIRTASGRCASSRRSRSDSSNAAAWVWATLTGSDWRYAPPLRLAGLPPAKREVVARSYMSFVAEELAKVEPVLLQFAAVILKRHRLAGPVAIDLDVTQPA